jgi:hypothetical protein
MQTSQHKKTKSAIPKAGAKSADPLKGVKQVLNAQDDSKKLAQVDDHNRERENYTIVTDPKTGR